MIRPGQTICDAMTPSRRRFLARSGSLLLGGSAPGLLRGSDKDPPPSPREGRPTLVTIYLRGGVDTLGVLVPFREARYAKLRPTLAVPAPDAKGKGASLPLDDTFAMNPNLPELHDLYTRGICSPVVCVGSHHSTRSHFDAQDFMERAAPGLRHVKDGWLNRYLSETRTDRDTPLRAIAMQRRLPRSLRGSYPVLATPSAGEATEAMDAFDGLHRSHDESGAAAAEGKEPAPAAGLRRKIVESGRNTIERLRYLDEIAARGNGASGDDGGYPGSSFGRQMRQVAGIIKADAGLEIAAVDYDGWDHHVDEGPSEGNMAKHLSNVSAGVGAFVRDLGPRMDRVLILLMSEFGRTVAENGNRGTDHGHGGLMIAVGGMVEGGRVLGRWNGLAEDQLYEGRDLPVHTDFRNVFAETLQSLLGFDGVAAGMFPEYAPAAPPLEFLRA